MSNKYTIRLARIERAMAAQLQGLDPDNLPPSFVVEFVDGEGNVGSDTELIDPLPALLDAMSPSGRAQMFVKLLPQQPKQKAKR